METKKPKKWTIVALSLIAVFLAVFAVWTMHDTGSVYSRHPEKFQLVAEYFCAHKPDGFPLAVYRSDFRYGTLPDEEWPQEVSDAVRYIFRHSRCNSIFAGRTNAGVSYCQFENPIISDSQNETGIIYTPREDGQEIFGAAFYLPVAHWSALSDHWFRYTLVSNYAYNSVG